MHKYYHKQDFSKKSLNILMETLGLTPLQYILGTKLSLTESYSAMNLKTN